MGVESFYIVSKISNDNSSSQIIECLENSNFSTVKRTLILGGIFKTKVTLDNEFVINDLIICSIDNNNNISFQLVSHVITKQSISLLIFYQRCKTHSLLKIYHMEAML